MSLEQIESEALNLPLKQRAELARKLLISLEEAIDSEPYLEEWMTEAGRRSDELASGSEKAVPAGEVFKRVRAGLG